MRYYIADLHFGHEKLNYDCDFRGFSDATEMDEYMIAKWNGKVRSNDEVVILGDFCISPKPDVAAGLLERLNGRKYLVRGNHDRFLDGRKFDRSLFGWIEDYTELNDNKRKIILSHYPIMCYNGQYRCNSDGESKVYMLYGHVHNTFDEYLIDDYIKRTRGRERYINGHEEKVRIPCQMINCFCMFSDYEPLTLDEWIEADDKRRSQLRYEDFRDGAEEVI